MISVDKILKILFLTCGLLLAGCLRNKEQETVKDIKGDVFGSYFLIKYRGQLEEKKFIPELNQFFTDFNNQFSTYHPNSLISLFNKSAKETPLKVSLQFIEMLKMAERFHRETHGAFDPTLGPVIKLWGFGGGAHHSPSEKELKEAMLKVGFHQIKWSEKDLTVWKDLEGVQLDVNAFAPGWASDLIGDLFRKYGIQNFMIDISGEIVFSGSKDAKQPWIGGIEKPAKNYAEGVHLAFKMKNLAIATSGNYRQFFDDKGIRRTHILDPRSGHPVSHLISSASVIAENAARADAWSTAMMVLGKEGLELAEKNGIKVLLLEAIKTDEFAEITSPSMLQFIKDHKL